MKNDPRITRPVRSARADSAVPKDLVLLQALHGELEQCAVALERRARSYVSLMEQHGTAAINPAVVETELLHAALELKMMSARAGRLWYAHAGMLSPSTGASSTAHRAAKKAG